LKEPETFEDTYYHPNHEERMKWREAILKEFDEMKEKGVYEKICKSELPNRHTCIKLWGAPRITRGTRTPFRTPGHDGQKTGEEPGIFTLPV
jgi:hypothetical protein